MNIDDSELLILLGNTRWYEPLQHVMYRATDNELIAVATVPGSTAHYTFSISPDKTTITGSGINRAGIKVELFTKTELLGSRRIAPDLLLGLSALPKLMFESNVRESLPKLIIGLPKLAPCRKQHLVLLTQFHNR
jgi:hypothetical protein